MNVLWAHFNAFADLKSRQAQIRKRRAAAIKDAAHAFMVRGERARARTLFRRSLAEQRWDWRAWMLMFANEIGVRR